MKSARISLDEFVLELDPIVETNNHSFLWRVKAKVTFPSGDIIATEFRYDHGKNWIIDPLVQKSRAYVQPDEEIWRRLSSHNYIEIVSERVTQLIESGGLKLRYDNKEGTLEDYMKRAD